MAVDKIAGREEKLRALQEKLTSSVEQLVTGEDWKRAIEFAARFRGRSFSNTVLIAIQAAEAYEQGRVPSPYPTYVAGYRQWQHLGRQVRAGSVGYQILAPVTARFASSDPADPASWHRLRRGEQPAPGEVTRSRMVGVKPATVFDAAMTDGDTPIPERPMPQLLRGQAPPGLHEGLVAEIESRGFTVIDVPDAAAIGGANGLTDFGAQRISIRADMDPAARCKTAAHELGHLALGHGPSDPGGVTDGLLHRGIAEVEAESFALTIGAAHGLATHAYTIPYVASWAASVPGKTPVQVVQATADKVCRTASQVLARLDTTQIGDGTPDGLHDEGRDVAQVRDLVVPGGAFVADRISPGGGGRHPEAGPDWEQRGEARLVDIGTGLRETVRVTAVHDDTVTVPAADGRIGRVGAARLSPVGAYEHETRPVSVTETSRRRALDEDNPVHVTALDGDGSGHREIPADPKQPRAMDPWSTKVGDRFVRDGKLWEAVRITQAGAGGTSRRDGPTVHAKIVRGDGALSDFTADIWSKSLSNPPTAFTHVESAPADEAGTPMSLVDEFTDPAQTPTGLEDALSGVDEAVSVTAQARARLERSQRHAPAQAPGGAAAARPGAMPPSTGLGV